VSPEGRTASVIVAAAKGQILLSLVVNYQHTNKNAKSTDKSSTKIANDNIAPKLISKEGMGNKPPRIPKAKSAPSPLPILAITKEVCHYGKLRH